ncbi:MAG: thiamine-phosphate kinase [Magnetococcales bacterium]|uniref:Thiamine-monophosphate kinase n=1 Tax=Candidatus Magnetobacterium casense TaxID=1455061 RepID=A0ABS6S0Z0_9BACT|nr:thiamine-phosphate kinase [Candidatus Magnetobacterium casensis]MBF0606517.1 thiamine-phosphate kinase [Nitrospirota bacterium]MBV6342476.1 thiamine-phosphate kinase [Candidatus Magnetobacterium casensis]
MSNQNPLRIDGELALIEHIRQRFTRKQPDGRGGRLSDGGRQELPILMVGIGDDAAVLRVGGKHVLLTTDAMAEGVHFDMAFVTPFQVGHKLVSVNVSDIYAMAGRPAYMLLTMSIPAARMAETDGFIAGFFDGVESALETYAVELIGGDITSSGGGINLSATLIGFAQSPALRSGAVVGDRIYVTGNLGDSACGLHLLRRINRPVAIEQTETINTPLAWHVMEPLLRRHLMPVVSAPVGTERVNAMMDISDGLSIDLRRLCEHSGVGARVYEANLPQSPAMTEAAAFLELNPTMLALCGGEDYQYLFTSPESVPGCRCIGEITESGFVFIDTYKKERELIRCGYEHFKN